MEARPPAPVAPIWLVGATAAASGLIGSVLAIVVGYALYPAGVGAMGFPAPRGFSAFIIALLFGFPFSSFVGAAGAYAIVLVRRRAAFGFVAVAGGVLTGAIVGWGTAGLGNWWATTVATPGFGWAEITLVPVAAMVASVLLSGRVALEMASTTRRTRLIALITGGLLVGALGGMLFGGVISYYSAFQSPCPPVYYPGGPECVGPGYGPGLQLGLLLGMWFGAAIGAVCGLIAWAVPPPRSDMIEHVPPNDSDLS